MCDASALTPGDQAAVLAFLDSLGRREFDADGDDDVDAVDRAAFQGCFGSTGVSPDDPCAVFDIDQDGDVDQADRYWFRRAFGT